MALCLHRHQATIRGRLASCFPERKAMDKALQLHLRTADSKLARVMISGLLRQGCSRSFGRGDLFHPLHGQEHHIICYQQLSTRVRRATDDVTPNSPKPLSLSR